LHLDTVGTNLAELGFVRGTVLEVKAVSGELAREGFLNPEIPLRRLITSATGQNLRRFDSEIIILETLASKLTHESKGTIRLFSDLPFCPSCSNAIKQFESLFPNIKVLASAGY
jgi:The  BURPS668_1122 family of deaminases